MAEGDPNPQGSRYTHNDAAFVEYNTRLQSNNLPTFTTAASKFTEWLGSDKAYYPNAKVPIVSIVESAHANICRVQGDPSVPFELEKALPGLDPWYQPYLSLLTQVGGHLNHFESELRARLQLLVENAGIRIVQVPTLTENTSTQSKSFPFTERAKENTTLVDASSQAASLSNQVQQSGTIPPVTNPETKKKGRRKLNRAIFDVDTAAALRTKPQTGPQTVEVKNPPSPAVTIRQEATGPVHPSNSLPEGPMEGALVEHASDVGYLAEEQPQPQSEANDPSLEVTVTGSSRARIGDSPPCEEVTDIEQPREESLVDLPQEAESAPTADSLPEKVETSNVDEELPGPPDSHPEATSKRVAMESLTDSLLPVPDPEVVGIGKRVEITRQPQDAFGVVEGVGSEVPSHSPDNVVIHGTVRRRDSDDSMGRERNIMPLEPPAKRLRMELEAATAVVVPSMSTSRAATPEALTRGSSDSVASVPWSLSVTHMVQRSSSDMILESENEATPPPRSDKGAADENPIRNIGAPPSEQQPLAEITSEPRTGTPAVESHENRVMETQMPPIQELSLASPEMKPNPFTAIRMTLRPPGALPPLVRSATIPDVVRFPFHAIAISNARSRVPMVVSQGPQQESPTQKTYIFSAAEINTLVASRGSDEYSNPNKLVFCLDWGLIKGITKWRNFKTGQGPLEGSVCLSLACYPVDSVAALMSTATEKQPFDALIRQARIKSSWPSGPGFRSTLKDDLGKSYTIPPFLTTDDDFVDISESAIPGTNTYTIEDNGQSLSNWLFAVYAHTPTIAYFDAVQAKVDKAKKWVEALASFTVYSLPAVNWDALQDPS